MATSRSSEPGGQWEAGASLFSGRPDPSWPLNNVHVARLQQIWAELAPTTQSLPDAAPLGYRGCSAIRGTDLEWRAYGGIVVLTAGGRSAARRDPERRFERAVLEAAPPGVLPEGLL